ncbi:MAG: quinolinate synthase NadA, partial [Clostridiales bacterium]|nr:quinolinate synthase NadA [Clostridiales bacterium]
MGSMQDIAGEIKDLKEKKNAIILAHSYQIPEVQQIADFVGDSFALSRETRDSDADMLVFCGVRFMAESAKILSPDKKVLLPVLDAGCPMADMVTPEDIRRLRAQHPGAAVVCYINSSAAVKAECDICCTSSNAVRVVRSLPQRDIVFVPDRNLGQYVAGQVPEKRIILYAGYCPVHNRTTPGQARAARAAHPEALLLVHPECPREVTQLADYVDSTAGIVEYAKRSDRREFIIGTEIGIFHALTRDNPDKVFHPLVPDFMCPD